MALPDAIHDAMAVRAVVVNGKVYERENLLHRSRGLFVHELESGVTRRLTEFGKYPQWLQDNRRLLFQHDDEPEI